VDYKEIKMRKKILDYGKIAELFVFPQKENYVSNVRGVQEYLNETLPDIGKILQPFTDVISNVSRYELEDLYLRSFEVQSITTLDIGYVVFGDDYKRGELLVNLNREHQTYNIDCGDELADNLSNILKLINVLDDFQLLNDLVNKIVAPALIKMIEGFGHDQIAAKEKVYIKHHKTLLQKHESFTIYKHALNALYKALDHDFNIKIREQPQRSGGFLSSIKQEIKLEP
jgi:nitrate reductase assembly molybdenum cofactor insertion protein NarJ